MEEMKLIYTLFTDMWKLCKQFEGRKLEDNEWEQLIDAGTELVNKSKQYGKSIELLCRDLFNAVQSYYERKKNLEE